MCVGGTIEHGVRSAWLDFFFIIIFSNDAVRGGSKRETMQVFHSLIFGKIIF